jgi:ketosteroid isomerase-like protein
MVSGAAACGCLAVLLLASGCQKAAAPVDPNAAVQAVQAADAQWSKAAGARDVEGVLSYYADGAVVLPANQELVTNKASIRKVWTDLLAPGTKITWTPGTAEVSSSGDLVYAEGFYLATRTAGKGKPVIDRGKYLSVWRKQADGSWKTVTNMWNSDLPLANAPAKKRN